ncbi:LysR substrate-binding domain-containing protein [Microvirga sp. 2MCAF35]|uniref:LysR family transcriptional regulator n=1 Tax=Microvirga sp. 2MCAF35 TaxID=3232987 RepID=UPI003F99C65D
MELSDLRIFRAVVQRGGITSAAKQLNRVQSNVTTRIQNLEEALGVLLFIREGKRLQLSSAGRVLLDYAEQILALVEQTRLAVHEAKPFGLLRLGTMESTAAARLPRPLCEYHERYPEVSIELRTGSPREQIDLVLGGELDAALIADPERDERLSTLPIFEEELVLVGNAKHPLIASPLDVQPRTVLIFHPGCPHRSRLEGWFGRVDAPIERMVELTSYHAMLGCAAAGMGVALMPLSVLQTYSERSSLSIHPIRETDFNTATTFLIWRRNRENPAVARFAEVLLKHSNAARA